MTHVCRNQNSNHISQTNTDNNMFYDVGHHIVIHSLNSGANFYWSKSSDALPTKLHKEQNSYLEFKGW